MLTTQLKTLSTGIGKMTRQEIEVWWDDDVLTGELMVSATLVLVYSHILSDSAGIRFSTLSPLSLATIC